MNTHTHIYIYIRIYIYIYKQRYIRFETKLIAELASDPGAGSTCIFVCLFVSVDYVYTYMHTCFMCMCISLCSLALVSLTLSFIEKIHSIFVQEKCILHSTCLVSHANFTFCK